MAITAPTPMMMPSMVRLERILLRASARIAIRMMASMSIVPLSCLLRRHGCDLSQHYQPRQNRSDCSIVCFCDFVKVFSAAEFFTNLCVFRASPGTESVGRFALLSFFFSHQGADRAIESFDYFWLTTR